MNETPLFNLEAEQSVLGSILLVPDLIDECYLQPEEFSDDRHTKIMEFMRDMTDIGKPIDILVMAEFAGNDLMKIGGPSYLTELSGSVPTTANFGHYQEIVRKLYIHRRTVKTLERMADVGAKETIDAREYIGEVQEALDEIAAITEGQEGEFRKMSDVLDGHEKELIKRRSQLGLTGAKTASTELDRLTGGHQDGDLEIIAARPSIGKTAYVVNDMVETARSGRAAAIFSLEMDAKKISERAACAISNLDSSKVRTGALSDTDWEKWTYSVQELERLPILVSDSPDVTLQQIDAKVKRLKKQYLRLVVYVDYLQLVNPGRRFNQPHEGVAYVSKGLKRIARKHNVPVIAISAVGRSCEQRQDKRPMMSDLRESGSIESDADIVIFLFRDDYYNTKSEKPGIMELILAKGRNVGTGIVEMVFNKKTGRFLNIDRTKKESGTK